MYPGAYLGGLSDTLLVVYRSNHEDSHPRLNTKDVCGKTDDVCLNLFLYLSSIHMNNQPNYDIASEGDSTAGRNY